MSIIVLEETIPVAGGLIKVKVTAVAVAKPEILTLNTEPAFKFKL